MLETKEDNYVLEVSEAPTPLVVSEAPTYLAIEQEPTLLEFQKEETLLELTSSVHSLVLDQSSTLLEVSEVVYNSAPIEGFFFDRHDLDSGGYYYFGGANPLQAWKVNRWSKDSLVETSSLPAENPTVLDLDAAWAARESLIYS